MRDKVGEPLPECYGNCAALCSGHNGSGESGYGGPRPPAGHGPHHYYFWVYALDTTVEGDPSREAFLQQYADHVIEQNRVIGAYAN